MSEFSPGAAEAARESSEGDFDVGEQQCICKTRYIALLKNDLFVPRIFKMCLYSLTLGGLWLLLLVTPRDEQVDEPSLGCVFGQLWS